MARPHTGVFRVRRGWFGRAILQELMDYPTFNGFFVDASHREHKWEDVDYDHAPEQLALRNINMLL